MADQTVSVIDNSKERVALDLLKYIRSNDSDESDGKQAILKLYYECRKVVYGGSPA